MVEFNDRRFDPQPHIDAIKKGHAALRRLGSGGGASMATFNAMRRHNVNIDVATRALVDNGHKDVVGQLVDEHQTKQRLAEAAAKEQYRPELERRLKASQQPRKARRV